MRKILSVLALSLSAMAVAHADTAPSPQYTHDSSWSQGELQAIDNWLDQFGERFEDWWYSTWGSMIGISDPDASHGGGPVAAPEFDPAAALGALTLLAGGLAVVRGRRSKG